MGETEISVLGAKVCNLQKVDSVKPESSKAVDAPSAESPPPSTSFKLTVVPKNYKCTKCDKTFSKPSKLKNHMHLHTGERPFACKHTGCDKAYTNSSHLLRHMKSHQGNVAPLQICLQCKAMFRSAGGLKKHMKTIHMTENEYPYSCQECGRAFRKKKLLSYHMHEHGGDPAFRCEHCNVQFTHKFLYNRHMRGHRTHPCRKPGCPAILANWSLFRKHMALHSGEDCTIEILSPTKRGPAKSEETTEGDPDEPPSDVLSPVRGRKCPVCDVVISSRSRYYTHIEQHKEVMKCPHPACDRVYTYKRNLDTHVRLHHTTETRFVCDICHRNLASKQKLEMHKISIHVNNGPKKFTRKSKAAVKPRKDKGTKKRALAARLAGIEIPYDEEKRLLQEDHEFRKGDPLSTSGTVSSPDSGFFSIPGVLRSNLRGSALSSEGHRSGEVADASDLQGPSETQNRNENHQDSSSDEEFMYSGGDSSDEESGSGHCEDDEDEDADGDGDDRDDDDEEGDDHDDDDLDEDEDEDEGEESNGHDEGGAEEREGHRAQGEGSSGKRPGSESPSRDEGQDGAGDFGVDRDSAIPSVDSGEESREECVVEETAENQRRSKRKADDMEDEASKRQRGLGEAADSEDDSAARGTAVPDLKQLNRNVDASVFEVKVAKEKVSQRLPEDVWVSTFQTSIDHCLPDSANT